MFQVCLCVVVVVVAVVSECCFFFSLCALFHRSLCAFTIMDLQSFLNVQIDTFMPDINFIRYTSLCGRFFSCKDTVSVCSQCRCIVVFLERNEIKLLKLWQ